MHDMIVAVDIGVRDDIMRMVANESADEQSSYGHKVSDEQSCCSSYINPMDRPCKKLFLNQTFF